MYSKLLLGLMLVLLAGTASASDQLPASTPSGILVDRVLPMAHLEDLNGKPHASIADLGRFRQAVHELKRSAEYDLGWPDVREIPVDSDPAVIPLAVLLSPYDRVNDALEVSSQLIFAFAPLRQDVYYGQSLSFVLPEDNVLLRGSDRIVRWSFKKGSGQEWQDIEPGKPWSVSFASTGTKNIYLRATTADQTQYWAQSVLQVKRLATPDPTDTWNIVASETYQGVAGTGQAYIYLAEEHAELTNPVVVVEGFDLDNTMDWPVLYDFLNRENLLEDLRADGYDAVVLDFTDAVGPIQRNGFVLTQLLNQVHSATAPETSVALVGASMGGLVSRYALTWLENEGMDHGVRTFVSFDSPQNGANIPLGLQHWLDFFKGESADAEFLLSLLDSPAARQMLLYHHLNPSTSNPGPDSQFQSFRSELATLGDWPEQPRLVSVANGSGSSADQGYAAGDQIIFYEYRSVLADIDGHVWAVPEGNSQPIFEGMIDLIWPLPDTDQTVTVSGTLPWDNAPGGFRPSMAQMDTTAVPYGDIIALHDAHCFIPTISALALDVVDPFFEMAGSGDLLALTPFDAVYYPAQNQEHILITPENKVWLMDEVRTGVSPVEDQPSAQLPVAILHGAVPNPFNPEASIRFSLAAAEQVDLGIYDLSGRLVHPLISGDTFTSGEHQVTWNGRGPGGNTLPSGVYLCRLKAAGNIQTQRLTLLK